MTPSTRPDAAAATAQPWWNRQRPSAMPVHRYRQPRAAAPLEPAQRSWLGTPLTRAPLWSSVDLRDGNQALANPMDRARKLEMFRLLVRMGFKDIEVGYPSSSEAEFQFVRDLVEADLIPDDVTITVFTPAKAELIERTFDSIRGTDRAIVHLCHATACLWRDVVFRMSPSEVLDLARVSARQLVRLADRSRQPVRFQYSPETFNVTEPEFALEISNLVADIVEATPDRPLTLNLPTTVETDSPDYFADQIQWMHRSLERRDSIILSVHPHNDRGTAVAAAEYALAAGADRVEGTLFGNGERTGNVCLVTLALNLFSRGIDPQLDISDIGAIREIVERCNEMPVHARHPYAGDLVFTAFSGTHQDAVAKGLAALDAEAATTGRSVRELPWQVPYLPIDPRDVGRSYEAIIRVNSQSGKGGIAHVLRAERGIELPVPVRVEFAKIVQRVTDVTGHEVSSVKLWDLFCDEYCGIDSGATVRMRCDGGGTGDVVVSLPGLEPIAVPAADAAADLVTALGEQGVQVELSELVTGETGAPGTAGSQAVAYARIRTPAGERPVWGVGFSSVPALAGARAVLAALRRGGVLAERDQPAPLAAREAGR
ncbi:MAG: 2-isopropylmalate synthase [Pseudonocardiales bacterium]|nr:2-isopropylmalate synthase [Pseudonocardiales bacterium]